MSQEASLTVIAICCLLSVAAFVAVVVAAVVFVVKTKRSLEAKGKEIMDKVDPIVQDARAISTQAKETVDGIAARVDSIAGRVEETTTKLTDRVDDISDRVDTAVTPNLVTAVGTAATVAKVVEIVLRTSKVAQSAKTAAGEKDKTE